MFKPRDDRQLRSLTGASEEVLTKLEAAFSQAYERRQQQAYEQGQAQGKRRRKPGAGRKGVLNTMRSKLCFTLYYLKTYPTFDVLAEKFNLSRSNAHANLHKLLPVLSEALASLGYLPKGHFASAEEFKAVLGGIDAILIDVTERECCRPVDDAVQKEHYSGKKGYHTHKNTIIASPEKVILFVGQTFSGRNHDYAMFKSEFPSEQTWFEGVKVRVDLGYQGIKTDYPEGEVEIPFKKPRKSKSNPNPQLTAEQKAYNQMVSRARIYVENAIGGLKRYRILVDAFRNRLNGFVDRVIAVCAGLWNALIC